MASPISPLKALQLVMENVKEMGEEFEDMDMNKIVAASKASYVSLNTLLKIIEVFKLDRAEVMEVAGIENKRAAKEFDTEVDELLAEAKKESSAERFS